MLDQRWFKKVSMFFRFFILMAAIFLLFFCTSSLECNMNFQHPKFQACPKNTSYHIQVFFPFITTVPNLGVFPTLFALICLLYLYIHRYRLGDGLIHLCLSWTRCVEFCAPLLVGLIKVFFHTCERKESTNYNQPPASFSVRFLSPKLLVLL